MAIRKKAKKKKARSTGKTSRRKKLTKKVTKRGGAKKKAKKKKATKKKATKKKASKKKASKKKTAKKTKATKKKTAARKKTTKKKTTKAKTATKPKSKKPRTRPSTTTRSSISSGSVPATSAATERQLNVGEMAPKFSLKNQHGEMISLDQFLGKTVVLYFYPKDDTPGCTKEACSFRDYSSQIENKNAVVLGVSFDDEGTHQKFIEKYGLNFSLLADTEKTVAKDYGVYVQKNMYGKTYWGIERSTFVIDAEGKISSIFRKVKVEGHTEEVLEALSKVA